MPRSSRAQACCVAAWLLPRCSDQLEGTAYKRLRLLVPDNLSVHVSSTTARAPAVRVRLVSLEGPLKLAEALAILV